MRDSPDSFSRMRLKTGSDKVSGHPKQAAGANPRADARSPTSPPGRASPPDGEPGEALDHDVLARLGREVAAQLLDRLAVVLVAVDVLLVEQHDLAEPLLQLALDDLGPDVLRL